MKFVHSKLQVHEPSSNFEFTEPVLQSIDYYFIFFQKEEVIGSYNLQIWKIERDKGNYLELILHQKYKFLYSWQSQLVWHQAITSKTRCNFHNLSCLPESLNRLQRGTTTKYRRIKTNTSKQCKRL